MATRKRTREAAAAAATTVAAPVPVPVPVNIHALQRKDSFKKELELACNELEWFMGQAKRKCLLLDSADMQFAVPGCEGTLTYTITEASLKKIWCEPSAVTSMSTHNFVDAVTHNVQDTVQHWAEAMAAAAPGTTKNTAFETVASCGGEGVVVASGPCCMVRMTRFKTTTALNLFKGTKQEWAAARAAATKAARSTARARARARAVAKAAAKA
jgi:hypothetical protein